MDHFRHPARNAATNIRSPYASLRIWPSGYHVRMVALSFIQPVKNPAVQGEQREIQGNYVRLHSRSAAVGLFYAAAPAMAQEKTHRLVRQGILQVRGRRAARGDQEVRGQDRRQGRAVAIRHPGHDPEDGGGAGFRHARRMSPMPTPTTCRRRQMGFRGQARRPLRHPEADEDPRSRRTPSRPRCSTTTRPRRRPITPSR